ncbi:hypothetical protein MKK67_06830 [Methylobacterium sp. J-072]|uniref:hypothetical protein n=1 Tax=Methylobacterium sp. J-072 TaxID=2836651 RepID=UPI001FBA6BE8|nr:hypothetical protein [Methylobacterium sp. J-072]MCJ2092211.1 hypothetical protein [Methylobacterium sp. J-072]
MDEWILLSEAYRLLLITEQDPVLVERLLLPLLWHGELPAISRRAFVEDRLTNNLKVTTSKEWPWETSPIIFDWSTSRATQPRGFHRPTRDAAEIKFPLIEYYRIEIKKDNLLLIFPECAEDKSSAPEAIIKTGLVGRSTARHVIAAEIERRSALGERRKSIAAWGDELSNWLDATYGDKAPSTTSKTIQNTFRARLKQLLAADS